MTRNYTSKTADEWFALKKWTGFLLNIPIGRTVVKECESLRDILAIRSIAARLSNDAECEFKFSIETEADNERMICVKAERK